MKMTLTIWLILLALPAISQSHSGSANRKGKSSITDPAALSQQIISGYTTEKEKVKAIFQWITDNIAYYRMDIRTGKKRNRQALFGAEEADDGQALPSLSDRIAVKVLSDKQAVCEGYARLFKSLCDHAGITAAIITGYARTDMSRVESKFRSNHTWNAVYFDSAWHLLDATWASGYITMPSGDFVRQYDDYYFLTAPEKFIRHHYPDDLRWTLLNDPPALSEFRHTPFRQRSFNKYFITSYYPSGGIIEASVGDTIHLAIEMDASRRQVDIASDSLWDSVSVAFPPVYAFVQPEMNPDSDKVLYRFPVDSENVQWLHVMYNNDAVLRYKLNIRRTK